MVHMAMKHPATHTAVELLLSHNTEQLYLNNYRFSHPTVAPLNCKMK
jgi:hypothetical protein